MRKRAWLRLAVLPFVGTLVVVALASVTGSAAGPHATPSCERQAGAMPEAVIPAVPGPDGSGAAEPGASAGTVASPFAGRTLWVDPSSQASRSASELRAADDPRAQRVARVALQSTGTWLTSPDPATVRGQVSRTVGAAAAAGQVAVLVAYAIPLRDCAAGFSAGGARSSEAYQQWVVEVAGGLADARGTGSTPVAVILEPDALASLEDLPADRQAERLGLLRWATSTLGRVPGTAVYLDAGHSDWQPASVMAERLARAGVERARGFSLNVSNFRTTEESVTYGRSVAAELGETAFVVDVSRNGAGPDPTGAWCNPPGRALGGPPRIAPAAQVDALLWVKPPGESDGACAPGQPAAGMFSATIADDLAAAAGW